VGPGTRIEVVTEGVLTRMLRSDAGLENAGLVVFDEFHERSIHADLGLALTLQSRAILRPDLRILVMSATLEGEPVSRLLGGAPIITSKGRAFPVETRHVPPRDGVRLEARVAAAVRRALDDETGDVLAFLPGAGEIRRTERLLSDVDAEVIPLHGSLPRGRQDRALQPSAGRRKVVLATSIAETSLTVDGVRVVVDGGQARVPRYSPRTGMTRLVTVRVSRASADQRRGRAGRQGPGVCYRLWSAAEDARLLERAAPEILEADLASLALDLADAGVAHPGDLAWLDPPPEAAFAEAMRLLRNLSALDEAGRITPHGRGLSRYALHPRLAHMVVHGRELGAGGLACELAVLLAEHDLLGRSDGPPDADLSSRLDLLRGTVDRFGVDQETLRRARSEVRWCRQSAGGETLNSGGRPPVSAGLVLALAYPDRVARRRLRGHGRFLLRNGMGARVESGALAQHEFLVAAELDGQATDGRVLLALPIERAELEAHFAHDIVREDVLTWNSASLAVVSRRRRRLGAILLDEAPLVDPDAAAVRATLLDGIRREGLERLPWTQEALRIRARLAFLHRLDSGWPDVSDEALSRNLETWLLPRLGAARGLQDLREVDLGQGLLDLVAPAERRRLDQLAPTHVQVPTGSRILLDYSDPGSPVLAVRLQELFGQVTTPAVGQGRVPLTLHLLSPAGRPVQVTRDLAGFWQTSYFEVRKDLRGRYPKHHWPDDPLSATPTRRAKGRGPSGT
jgi:ATP-dependent helicase HrpB